MNIDELSQQYIKAISSHFVGTLTAQVSQRIIDNVASVVNNYDVDKEIKDKIKITVDNAVDAYGSSGNRGAMAIGNEIVDQLKVKTDQFIQKVINDINTKVFNDLQAVVNSTDYTKLIRDTANHHVSNMLKNHSYTFPNQSIPGNAVRTDSLSISADNITSGIIKKFESQGIQDKATRSQLTVSDAAIVSETHFVAKQITVEGDLSVKGNFDKSLTDRVAQVAVEKIESKYNEGTFDQYVNRVITKLDQEGIDIGKVKYNNQPFLADNTLHSSITNSNLQYLGLLKELQVSGETLLDDTLYVANKRMGINTLEPEHVLDIWDQEVQIIAAKKQKDVAFIGTARNQALILGSNLQNQLVLSPNGDITINRLILGKTTHSSSPFEPKDNRQLGEIVWNEQPRLGQPVGWVSLGAARWAKFGIITD